MRKLKILFIAFAFSFSAVACVANSGNSNSELPVNQNDSIVSAALGDSIFNIIKNAKSITAEIIGYTDTIKEKTPEVKLSDENIKIIKFLLMNPQNVSSNETVFGKVLPNICFNFKYKKQICLIYFDFGLGKWQIRDVDGKLLKTFDIKSPEFVNLSSKLFPNDGYLTELLKQ